MTMNYRGIHPVGGLTGVDVGDAVIRVEITTTFCLSCS